MRSRVAVAVVLLVGLAGCPSSPEEEQGKFERLRTDVKGLSALYPGFKAPLEARIAEATKSFEVGKAASDPKAQVNQMSEASRQLMAGYVSELNGLDSKIKDVRSKVVEVPGLANDDASKTSAKAAVDDAQKVLADVDARLKTGAKDEAEAKVIVAKIVGDVASAASNLDKVKAAIAAKAKAAADAKAKEEADKKAAADAVKAKEDAAKAAAAPWKCSKCDSKVDAKEAKCPNCGAARDQK